MKKLNRSIVINKNVVKKTEKTGDGNMNNKVEPNFVLDIFCDIMSVKKKDIRSESRNHDIHIKRQILCYVLKNEFYTKLKDIGSLINRDHSSVSYNISKVSTQKDLDTEFSFWYEYWSDNKPIYFKNNRFICR